jgi:hypothetical protein
MDEAIITLQDLASPVAAFVRDRCVRGIGLEIDADALWDAWKSWAEDNGHGKGVETDAREEPTFGHPECQGEAPQEGRGAVAPLPRRCSEGQPTMGGTADLCGPDVDVGKVHAYPPSVDCVGSRNRDGEVW